MNEISVSIWTDDLTQMTDNLWTENACGTSLYEISGADRDKREAIQEIVEVYTTGRSIIRDYVKITKDETIVSDWRFIHRQVKLGVFTN